MKVLLVTEATTVAGRLELRPGIIIKGNNFITGFRVQSGGSVNVTGSASNKVIFTDDADDTVGGDTTGDGDSSPGAFDYLIGIDVEPGASLDASHVLFKYGANGVRAQGGTVALTNAGFQNTQLHLQGSVEAVLDAINVDPAGSNAGIFIDGQAHITADKVTITDSVTAIDVRGQARVVFQDAAISNASNGLKVSSGAVVTYKGSFRNISNKTIQACYWFQECLVEAAYTDWGSADGPRVNGNWTACGAVQVFPWVYEGQTYEGQHMTPDCGDSAPDTTLVSAVNRFQTRMNNKQIDCSAGYQSACQAMETAMACLSGAVNIASSTSPIPLPEVSTIGQVGSFRDTLMETAKGSMISAAADALIPSSLTTHKANVSGIIGTFITMANAYHSCTPN